MASVVGIVFGVIFGIALLLVVAFMVIKKMKGLSIRFFFIASVATRKSKTYFDGLLMSI